MALDLGKKVGPLPLGAWIVVVGAGLGIAYYTRGDAGVFTQGDDELADDETFVEDTAGPDGVGTGGWTFTPPPVVTGPDVPPVDNDEWGQRAIGWLITSGQNAAWANAAITKALAGEKLGAREWTLWRLALMHMGPPPFPVIVNAPNALPHPPSPDDNSPKPPPKPAEGGKRVTGRWFVVKPAPLPGSTLRGISKLVYGDPSKWRDIYEANRKGRYLPVDHSSGTNVPRRGKIENPNVLRPGWVLYIPRGNNDLSESRHEHRQDERDRENRREDRQERRQRQRRRRRRRRRDHQAA